jgi:hypothetical protein
MVTYDNLKLWVFLIISLITIVSSWIIGIRMRRRIKKDLGRKANERDLTSVETWMKVDEVEQKKNPGREWVPQPVDLVPEDDLILGEEKPIDLFTNPKDKTNG